MKDKYERWKRKWLGKKIFVFIIILILLPLIYSLPSNKNILKVTQEHPFLINNNWIPASQLKVGELMTTVDGQKARITGIKDVSLDEPIPVYNLDTEFYDNFVAENGVVVHNSNKLKENPYKNVLMKDVNEILNIPDTPEGRAARLAEADRIYEEGIGKKLTQKQKDVIWEAHKVPRKNWIKKYRILIESGLFDEYYMRELLRRGICSGEPPSDFGKFWEWLGEEEGATSANIQAYNRLKNLCNPSFSPHKTQLEPISIPPISPKERASIFRRDFESYDTNPWTLDSVYFTTKTGEKTFFDPRISNNNVIYPLDGEFYVMILSLDSTQPIIISPGGKLGTCKLAGQAFIHPHPDILLKMYPLPHGQVGLVDSFVKIVLRDGELVRNPDGSWPITKFPHDPVSIFPDFRDSLLMRMDSLTPRPRPTFFPSDF